MRTINLLIVHCSATKPFMDIGAVEIRKWHTDPKPKGNGWRDIGYHFVIRRDGTVEDGRPIDQVGAHVAGHNSDSIGICLVGGVDDAGVPAANFTPEQWKALEALLRVLRAKFPKSTIHGHNEYAAKACPSFDVNEWIRGRNL